MRVLARLQDTITRWGFGLAAALLAVIVCSFCYEVASRYAFNAPTEWASPLVSYSLAAMIFLAMPALTRRGAHISINMMLESAPPARAAVMQFAIRVLAAFACFFAAWFSADASWSQFSQGIWTSPPFALPKWAVSVFVPYGMLSSGIYFVRQLFGEKPAGGEGIVEMQA